MSTEPDDPTDEWVDVGTSDPDEGERVEEVLAEVADRRGVGLDGTRTVE